ncbi:MAG TPA: copper resistance protein NlpE N-terminal domain-containing protein [Acidobacteriaceae bacterium]|nr:copper resistance protein NlpE N-terminal domain-containing protein [Acidobacteriaceae bacterium]
MAPQAAIAGTYQGRAPAADAAMRRFILRMSADGTAALTTIYIGKHSATQSGRWQQNGSELLLTFNPEGSNLPPSPISYRVHGRALTPIHWNQSEWGQLGPPVLHRSKDAALNAP